MKKITVEIIFWSLVAALLTGAGWLINPYRFATPSFNPATDLDNWIVRYEFNVGMSSSAWEDQTTNGDDLAAGANQPVYDSASNPDELDFDTDPDTMSVDFTGGTLSQPFTVVICARANSTDTSLRAMVADSQDDPGLVIPLWFGNGNWSDAIYAGSDTFGSSQSGDTSNHFWISEFLSGNDHLYEDGSLHINADSGSNGLDGILLNEQPGIGVNAMDMSIMYLGVLDDALTTAEKNNFGEWMEDASRCGITWNTIS